MNKQTYKVGEIKGILEGIYNDPITRRTVVPLFMSNSGMGKTFIIEEWMREKDRYRPPLVLSQRMHYEISGMSLVDKEKEIMKYYDFDSLLSLKDGDILFIDETYNASPIVLNAFLTFLESRIMISGRKLPDIMIVAAANPQGMPVLTPQIKRRFLQYDIIFDEQSYIDYMWKKYMLPKEIVEKLCQLIKKEDFLGYNYDTPADLDKVTGMIINGIKTPYDKSVKPILQSVVNINRHSNMDPISDRPLVPEELVSWLKGVQEVVKNNGVSWLEIVKQINKQNEVIEE